MEFCLFGSIDDYNPLDTQQLIDNSVTDFDIFVKVEDELLLYGGPGYEWRKDEVEHLIHSGVKELWFRNSDRGSFELYKGLNRLKLDEDGSTISDRVFKLEEIGLDFSKMLFSSGATPAIIHKGKQIGQEVGRIALEEPKVAKELSLLLDHDNYTYAHSVRVSMYSACIASQLELGSETVTDIAVGALFHDVGKRSIDLDVINKMGALSEDEWELIRSHPVLGFNEVKEANLCLSAKEIILHHHEALNGTGYPHGLKSAEIFEEVKIVTLADIFDALTSCRSYQRERNRFEALTLIKTKMIGKKIEKAHFEALVNCLS